MTMLKMFYALTCLADELTALCCAKPSRPSAKFLCAVPFTAQSRRMLPPA
jgi:hypothetical protein